jgi:hypothetical protein
MKNINTILLLFLLWTPRILSVLFAVLVAFLGHLLPPVLVIIILILSWRWSWIGGIIYLSVGIAYLAGVETWDAIIYVPLFLNGVLFLLCWYFRKEIKNAQDVYWGEEVE